MRVATFRRMARTVAFFVLSVIVVPWGAASARDLSLEDRIQAQRAIEEVYWRHRIWPQENPELKPAFSALTSDEAIRSRVEDFLERSKALETLWGRPITGEQLQAEVNRMVRQTRDPVMLRELFAALGNDPRLIAETLARNNLSDRLVRRWYAFDERFHADVRRQAERELAAVTNGTPPRDVLADYDERTWSVEDGTPEDSPRLQPGLLAEDGSAFLSEVVFDSGVDSGKVAVLTWPKVPFETWWAERSAGLETTFIKAEAFDFVLPDAAPLAGLCTEDTWSPLPPAGVAFNYDSRAVWTGTEMIVVSRNRGARFEPGAGVWTPMSSPADARGQFTLIWTGSLAIRWGGYLVVFPGQTLTNSGDRYDVATDMWSSVATTGAPVARQQHTAMAKEPSQMIVWGGLGSTGNALEGTQTAILEDPPPGEAYIYLVTVVTASGEGTLGEDSDGVERINAHRCAP